MDATYKISGGKVAVHLFYEDKMNAADAKVEVRDTHAKVIASGQTDKQGRWSFPAPQAGKYTVAFDAGNYHTLSLEITVPAAAAIPTPQSQAAAVDGAAGVSWQPLFIGLGALAAACLAMLVGAHVAAGKKSAAGRTAS
jgi:hypothetical protein